VLLFGSLEETEISLSHDIQTHIGAIIGDERRAYNDEWWYARWQVQNQQSSSSMLWRCTSYKPLMRYELSRTNPRFGDRLRLSKRRRLEKQVYPVRGRPVSASATV